MVNSQK